MRDEDQVSFCTKFAGMSLVALASAACLLNGRTPPGAFDPVAIQELLDDSSVPGVSIAVVNDFQLDWAQAYGVADIEAGTPVTPDTIFQAASISKPVAAMASLRAVQEGFFTLDQDINTVLTSWKLPSNGFAADRPVTPRSLMSHTSGTGDGFGFPGYSPNGPVPSILQGLNGLAPSTVGPVRLERPPLTAFEYSGGGVTIQQLALTDAVGKPFEQIAQEWIFKPLGMTNSTFQQPLPREREPQAARAHGPNGEWRSGEPWRVYPEQAAGGLWSTPADIARFVVEVQKSLRGLANRVLSQAMVQEMVRPVGVGPYGIGFQIEKRGEGWYFMHRGDNWGFQCTLVAHSLKGYGAVIMTNGTNGDVVIEELLRRIELEYDWDVLHDPTPRMYGPTPPGR